MEEHGLGFVPSTRVLRLANVDMEFDGVYLDLQSKRKYGMIYGVWALNVFEFDENGNQISTAVIPNSGPMKRAVKFFLSP